MSTKRGLLKGPKINQNHSTLTNGAEIVVDAARKHEQVKSVVVSIIEPKRGGRRSLKMRPVPAGLKIKVQGDGAVQTLFVYTGVPETVWDAIETAWKRAYE